MNGGVVGYDSFLWWWKLRWGEDGLVWGGGDFVVDVTPVVGIHVDNLRFFSDIRSWAITCYFGGKEGWNT